VTAEAVVVPIGDGATFGKESELLDRAPLGNSGELSGGGGCGAFAFDQSGAAVFALMLSRELALVKDVFPDAEGTFAEESELAA
jgi:hypothetical protein